MIRVARSRLPQQLAMILETKALDGLEATERAEAGELLAQLLLEACGAASEEDGDEDV